MEVVLRLRNQPEKVELLRRWHWPKEVETQLLWRHPPKEVELLRLPDQPKMVVGLLRPQGRPKEIEARLPLRKRIVEAYA